MREAHDAALQDLRSACERDVTEAEEARRSLAEEINAVEARVAEADRRCVGAEEAAAALSRDIDEERARAVAADALVAERDAALAALSGRRRPALIELVAAMASPQPLITASTPSTRQPRRRDEVAALQSNSSDDIAVGAELSGKFSGDGQYYDVIVEEVTDCVEIKSRAPRHRRDVSPLVDFHTGDGRGLQGLVYGVRQQRGTTPSRSKATRQQQGPERT